MNSDTDGWLVYLALVASVSVIAHFFFRRFWVTCGALAVASSILNIGYEIVVHDFRVRPSDVAFWLPMLFVYGAGAAFVVAVVIGVPFVVFRRGRKTP